MSRINLKLIYSEAPYLRPLISTLIIYLIFVYLLTLNPFRFSLFYFNRFIQFRRGYLAAFIGGSWIEDIILNLMMLFPLGLLIGLLLRMLQIKIKHSVIIATGLGFLISLSIELCQIFLPRSFSGIDIFANTVGACIGAWLAYPTKRFDTQEILKKLYDRGQFFYTRVVIIYCVVATIILMIPVFINTFSNWNNRFHLLFGNEATLNRPWRGIIYKLSIFNRKLDKQAIQMLYQLNFQTETPLELSNGLLAEYIFDHQQLKTFGVLKDKLVLNPQQQLSFNFEDQGGIILKDNSIISTNMPATELVHSIQKTNQLSIAIWLKPDNLQQKGPARIVSLSKNTDHRNFTLGQSGSMLNFRVRTPLTGLNGSEVDLTTYPMLTINEPQFVVATFHRGESKLFYNGKIVSSIIYDTSYYLPLLARLSRNRFGKAAFCFMLLFPLGWLGRGLVKSKIQKSVISAIIIFVPFLISSLVNTLLLQHTFDAHLFYLCGFISLLLLMIGLLYELLFAE